MTVPNYNLMVQPNFKLTTQKLPGVEFFATDVTWPTVSLGAVTINTPRGAHYEPGVTLNFEELNVEFLVDEDMQNYFEIYRWMREAGIPPKDPTPYPYINNTFFPFSDLTVTVLSNSMMPMYSVTFVNAFPIFLGNIPFQSGVDEPRPIKCPVTFRYDHFEKTGTQIYNENTERSL